MATKRPPKPEFDAEPPTLRAQRVIEAVARDAEGKHRKAAAIAAKRTVPGGIIPMRAISDVELAKMEVDVEARAFLAEVDGVRSAPDISRALGMQPAAGFVVLERLLFAGIISLRE